MLGINEFAKSVHENAVAHGWWDEERSFGDIVALCHSELSEALEAYRSGEDMLWIDHCNGEKPEGMAVELCDCVIRIFDYLAKEGIDIEAVIASKHLYNATRPYRHGGKKL